MNVELRMWNFELVARRAMKNYSIKNYLASYSIFLLVSPSLLGFLSPGNGGTEGGVKTIEGWEGSSGDGVEVPVHVTGGDGMGARWGDTDFAG